jgi:hypothetical protein
MTERPLTEQRARRQRYKRREIRINWDKIVCPVIVIIVLVPITITIIFSDIYHQERVDEARNTILDEGSIDEMGIKCSDSICDDYYIKIDGKEWLVTEEDYNQLEVGYVVRVHDDYGRYTKYIVVVDDGTVNPQVLSTW